MLVTYVDEAGDGGMPHAITGQVTPVYVIAALTIDSSAEPQLMRSVLEQRRTFSRAASSTSLITFLTREAKGADLRVDMRRGAAARARKAAFDYLHQTIELLAAHGARFTASIFVKDLTTSWSERDFYASALQVFARDLHHRLEQENEHGQVVLDRRAHHKDRVNVQAVLEHKWPTGPPFGGLNDMMPRLRQLPLTGISTQVMGLQLADTLASALLFPMACMAYRRKWTTNDHVNVGHLDVVQSFAPAVRQLEYRYRLPSGGGGKGNRRGGIRVVSPSGSLPQGLLYQGW